MRMTCLFRYTRNHWTGSQSLAWSFWVNLVALRIAISIAQSLAVANRAMDAAPMGMSAVTVLIFAHLAVFLWQVVGVLRAGERHLRHLGSISSTWGTQLGILIATMFVLSDIWSAWLLTSTVKDDVNFSDQMAHERAQTYSLKLLDDKITLQLSGEIPLGITKSVAALLATNPQIDTLSLSSGGGNIYEARGLAKLVRDARIDTLAVDDCSSACTIAFIGGVSRQLAPSARLGFHQYRVDATYDIPFANRILEQDRDRELFRENGVKDWFVERMFQETPEKIWYPSESELQKAGVLVSK